MFKQIVINWKNNFGPQLTFIGVTAALVMSFLWYQDLLPRIRFSRPIPLPRRLYGETTTSHFVAKIDCIGTETNAGDNPTTGSLVVFPHDEFRTGELRSPILTKQFYLDTNNSALVVVALPPGSYTAYAYLDLNENERLDLDGETGQPLEPVKISDDSTTQLDDLPQGAFVVSVDRPYFCVMELDASRRVP